MAQAASTVFLLLTLVLCGCASNARVCTVNGAIRDETGAPVKDAMIMVVEGSAGFSDIAASTDASGKFGLSLGKGTYKILVKTGPDSYYFPLEIAGDKPSVEVNWTVSRKIQQR